MSIQVGNCRLHNAGSTITNCGVNGYEKTLADRLLGAVRDARSQFSRPDSLVTVPLER